MLQVDASHSTPAITTELGITWAMRSGRINSTISAMSDSFSNLISNGLNTGGFGINQKPIFVQIP
ncbi:hypothetical protein D3C81_2095100 [compost metagenome]